MKSDVLTGKEFADVIKIICEGYPHEWTPEQIDALWDRLWENSTDNMKSITKSILGGFRRAKWHEGEHRLLKNQEILNNEHIYKIIMKK